MDTRLVSWQGVLSVALPLAPCLVPASQQDPIGRARQGLSATWMAG